MAVTSVWAAAAVGGHVPQGDHSEFPGEVSRAAGASAGKDPPVAGTLGLKPWHAPRLAPRVLAVLVRIPEGV